MWPHKVSQMGTGEVNIMAVQLNLAFRSTYLGKHHSRTVAHCCREAGIFLKEVLTTDLIVDRRKK
jgi:hypothetical protein